MCSGSSPGLKGPGRGVSHLPPSSAEVKEGVEVYLYSLSVAWWQFIERDLFLPFYYWHSRSAVCLIVLIVLLSCKERFYPQSPRQIA